MKRAKADEANVQLNKPNHQIKNLSVPSLSPESNIQKCSDTKYSKVIGSVTFSQKPDSLPIIKYVIAAKTNDCEARSGNRSNKTLDTT